MKMHGQRIGGRGVIAAGVLALGLLSGCASSFHKPAPNVVVLPPPTNVEVAIKSHFEVVLKDPESARYRFGLPRKAYLNNGLIHGGTVAWVGYVVRVDVNAKNSMGGYTGHQPYLALFSGDRLYSVLSGADHVMLHEME